MNTQSSQPRAIYYVVALQIWEYFSFYGMRALLILYLTNQLKYDDNHAYALFSAYCSLVYVTPILGGFLADKLLGNRMAVMIGALLMAIGHLVLGASEIAPTFLYLSLAIIVCGYGLFKSNVSCLLGELYEPTDPRRDGGFSLMYAAGNIGSIIAPIACGYVQEEYSWAMGFALAAIGMIAGLVIFLCGSRHFRHTSGVNREALRARHFLLPNWGWLLVLLVATPLLITVLLTLGVILVNGWTDAPNAIATCISTRAMRPRAAIAMAAVFNFLGVLVMTMLNATVAQTIYNMVRDGRLQAQKVGREWRFHREKLDQLLAPPVLLASRTDQVTQSGMAVVKKRFSRKRNKEYAF